jgi:3-isopropylmalate/(R)-2-methylmalate dehydratase small subunit
VKPFRCVTSRAVVLDRPDVDTDQIMPKQFLKRIERTGYGEFVFHEWRRDPGFVLNGAEAAGAQILIAGRNFGCGSSREHAPWGLQDWGFDAIVAPSYGEIFRQNCLKIGLLAVTVTEGQAAELAERARSGEELTVDLERTTAGGYPFEIDAFQQRCLLEGLDEIGLTLAHEAAIAAYEQARD